jgi:hypothetical protein
MEILVAPDDSGDVEAVRLAKELPFKSFVPEKSSRG